MIERLTANTQAILLLTAPLIAGRSEPSRDLLSLGDYNRLARILREEQKQPADLIGTDAAELIAHDCALVGNPSHTGVDDLEREYDSALHSRMVLYHYGSAAEGAALAARGYRVARPGEVLDLPSPSATPVLPP